MKRPEWLSAVIKAPLCLLPLSLPLIGLPPHHPPPRPNFHPPYVQPVKPPAPPLSDCEIRVRHPLIYVESIPAKAAGRLEVW